MVRDENGIERKISDIFVSIDEKFNFWELESFSSDFW